LIIPTWFSSWHPFLWATEVNYIPNDFISLTGGISKELLEGFTALDNKKTYINYNLNAVLQPLPYVSLVGTKYKLAFNDDNTRNGYTVVGKVIVIPTHGIYAGYRIRNYTSAFQSPIYFSPDHYNEGLYLAGISHRIGETWRYFIEGAKGQQTIKPNPTVPAGSSQSWYYRVGLRGAMTRCVFLDIRYGSYNQAGAFSQSIGYRYYDLSAVLNISLDT
jgi:hypothetical protein